MNQTQLQDAEMTYTEFVKEVKEGHVEAAHIDPNEEVPTGVVSFKLEEEDGTKKVNVSNIEEVEELLQQNDVNYEMDSIPQETIWDTLLPTIILVLGFGVIMLLMNRQGGSANAQAMNFGKSRARMSTDKDKKFTFADVAGLKEE